MLATLGIIQSSRPSGTLLLDLYSSAAAAYSLRKLRTAYSGSAIRVRRSSDNTEQDIGFDGNGNLNESELTSFVGANSGYVTKWYDQSGNARDAAQTTSANQPRIVNAGTVEKENNKPTLAFASNIGTLIYSNPNGFGLSNYSVITVSKSSGLDSNGRAIGTIKLVGGNGNGFFHLLYRNDITNNFRVLHTSDGGTSNIYIKSPNATYPTTITLNSFYAESNGYYYLNNSLQSTSTSIVQANFTSFLIQIGSYFYTPPFNYYHNGSISEFIVYLDSRYSSRDGISSNINSYYSIY